MNHSCMRYSASNLVNGSETPHFERILVCNAMQDCLERRSDHSKRGA
jgi:hypothetical protein